MRSVYETERSEPFAFAFRPAWEAGLFLKPCKAGKRCVLEEVFIVFFLTVLWSYYSDDFCFFSLSKSYNRLIAWSKKPLLQGPFGIFYRRCRVFFFYYWKKRVHLCTFFLQSWRNVDQELLAHISEKKEKHDNIVDAFSLSLKRTFLGVRFLITCGQSMKQNAVSLLLLLLDRREKPGCF